MYKKKILISIIFVTYLHQIYANNFGLENLGARIQAQVQRSLKPLENLGKKIEQDVYKSLKPVRELQFKLELISGRNGHTFATFQPSGRRFLVQNGIIFQCLNEDCNNANLGKFIPEKDEDYCFLPTNVKVNNYLCFPKNSGGVNFSLVGNAVRCTHPDGSPAFLIDSNKFVELCKNVANTVNYQYFTNFLPNDIGNDINCFKNKAGFVCTFDDNISRFLNSHSSVVVNNWKYWNYK